MKKCPYCGTVNWVVPKPIIQLKDRVVRYYYCKSCDHIYKAYYRKYNPVEAECVNDEYGVEVTSPDP